MMRTGIFGLAVAMFGGPALAEWSGPYIGGTIGYDFGSGYSTVSAAPLDVDGGQFGVFGGTNFQTDRFVYGFELNASKDNAKGQNGVPAFGVLNLSKQYSYGAKLRAGLDMGQTLPYISVGIERGAFDAFYTTGTSSETLTPIFEGRSIAIGLDYVVGSNSFVRAEIEHVKYSDERIVWPGFTSDTAQLDSTNLSIGYAMRF